MITAVLIHGLLLLGRLLITAADDPRWLNAKFSTQQNIVHLLTSGPRRIFYVYQGTRQDDILVPPRNQFKCPRIVVKRKTERQVHFMRWSWTCRVYFVAEMKYTNKYEYKNYMTIQRVDNPAAMYNMNYSYLLTNEIEPVKDPTEWCPKTHNTTDFYVVYSDYRTCALISYGKGQGCELWLFFNPGPYSYENTVCHMLYPGVCGSTNTYVYFDKDCR